MDSHLRRWNEDNHLVQWKVAKEKSVGIDELGINPWQAKLTAGLGNRYMSVSKMPAVKKAISYRVG